MNMEDMVRSVIKSIKVSGSGSVLHKPGAIRLDYFPLLVYAPSQWGPGVRCEKNGASVEEIAVAFAQVPNLELVASQFGVTADHVAQAVEYAVRVGFAEEQ